jgi:hypothetical protein
MQRSDQLEEQFGRIVDFLEKVDIRRPSSVKAGLKRESVTLSGHELPQHGDWSTRNVSPRQASQYRPSRAARLLG